MKACIKCFWKWIAAGAFSNEFAYFPSFVSSVENQNLEIYPNPNSGRFQLQVPSWNENTVLILRDLKGRLRSVESVYDNGLLTVDCNDCSNDMYILTLTHQDSVSTVKLIIRK